MGEPYRMATAELKLGVPPTLDFPAPVFAPTLRPMKFMAKHPSGAAYELTRDEMVNPRVVQSLNIDETWVVRVGANWISMKEFLAPPNPTSPNQHSDQLAEASTSAVDLLAPNASWTPGVVIAVTLRLIGVYLLFQVFRGVVSLIAGIAPVGMETFNLASIPDGILVRVILSHLGYLAAGLYLVTGPRALVAWMFPTESRRVPSSPTEASATSRPIPSDG